MVKERLGELAGRVVPGSGGRAPILGFGAAAASLLAFAGFAVVRPLVSSAAYYGPRRGATGYAYTWAIAALFCPYLIALRSIRRPDGPSLRKVTVLAAAVWGLLLVAPLIQSQDLFQYLFYARMQVVHGANPYVVRPSLFAGDPWFPWVGWPAQPSVYGPLWTAAMEAVVALARGSVLRAMFLGKVLAVALGAVAAYGLVQLNLGRGERRSALVVALFALNPLVLSAVPLSGHADVAVAAAFVWAIVVDRRGRTLGAVLLLTAATLVKPYAALALVAYLIAVAKRDGSRAASVGAVVAGCVGIAAFAPYWEGLSTFAAIASVADKTSASLSGDVLRVATAALGLADVRQPAEVAGALVRVAGLGVMVAAFAGVLRRRRDPWIGVMSVTAAYLLVTPWFLPWHALGLLALAVALPESPLSGATRMFAGSCLAAVGAPGALRPVASAAARYGPPALAYVRRDGADRDPRRRDRLLPVDRPARVAAGAPR
ncbi:MAG: DUF2029 domain-containing protein [Actinobacteria bacterium]|nr:DUF2029 domain-containing protein [Actinomycetota bacterium]